MWGQGGFGLSPYMRDVLAARNAGSDKRYEEDQAKANVDADTRAEMGRAAQELADTIQKPKLPGADNPFWAKPAEYREPPKPEGQPYYEVPHTMGAIGPVKPYVEPQRDYAQQAAYNLKGLAADPNVQEKIERDNKLEGLAALFGNKAAAEQTQPVDPDASTQPWWKGRGIR